MRNRTKKQHIIRETYKNKQNASRMKHLSNSCRGFSCKCYLQQQNVCLSIVMSQSLQYVLFNQYYTSLNDIALPYESILIHSRRIKLLIALKLNCICNYSLQFISLHRNSEIYHTHMLKQTRNMHI